MSRLKLFIPVGVFLVLALLLWRGLYLDPRTLPSVLIDKPLPEFSLPIVEQSDRLVSKADLPKEPFLLNVWGSYCLPCLQENPILKAAAADGVLPIIGINYKDKTNLAQMWMDDNGSPFEFSVVDADGRLGIDLGVYGAPETFVIDGNGVIRYKHIGVIDYHAGDCSGESGSPQLMTIFRALINSTRRASGFLRTLLQIAALALLCMTSNAWSAIDTFEFDNDEQQQRFRTLSNEFRCPMCQNTSLTGSGGGVAEDLRREIYLMIVEGKTDAEIEQFMLERYGDFIFYKPRLMTETLLLWFGPLLFLMLGGWIVMGIIRRARPQGQEAVVLDNADQARLHKLLEKVDGQDQSDNR